MPCLLGDAIFSDEFGRFKSEVHVQAADERRVNLRDAAHAKKKQAAVLAANTEIAACARLQLFGIW